MRTVKRREDSTALNNPVRRAIECLEARVLMTANPVISEFMTKNSSTLLDGNKNYSDWIELQNTGDASVNLTGWHLTDDATDPAKWTFPGTTLAAGGFLIIFADGSAVVDPAGYLHTNFSLSADGEVLSLTRPDLTVASQWNSNGTPYPSQLNDVSYGSGVAYHGSTLIGPHSPVTAFVPHDASLDAGQWTATNYDTTGWTSGTTGVGYDTNSYEDNSATPLLTGDWKAQDLTGGALVNGSAISTWTDGVGHASANASGSPKLVTNDFGTNLAGVRFDPTDGSNDNLRVPTSHNPLAGAGDFTVAVVFKTGSGIGGQSQWYSNAGLVDGEENGTTDDWGLAVAQNGASVYLGAGMGNPDTTIYSPSINTATHVAVYVRSHGTFTLYVDGGNGVSGVCGSADLDFSDMVFGSIQTNNNYFTGDIAEIQTFDGAASTSVQAKTLAQPLATLYSVNLAAATLPPGPLMTADWVGDAFAGNTNGSLISAWSSTISGTTYTVSNATTATQPSLSTNQLSGHAVVHFTGSSSTRLLANSTNNPLSNANDFTVAVVFRTSTPGAGSADAWYNNSGLVDAEQGGVTDDWGLAINSGGQAAAGIGNPDATIYSGGLLADGKPHVLVYTRAGGTTELYVDGLATPYDGTAGTNARNAANMVFGSIATGLNYFTGDLAEVQTYNGSLNNSSADQLAGSLAAKYGVALAPSPYAPLINLDLQSAMSGTATTADLRVPFTVSGSPSIYTRLLFQMQYDDGFVAYLNGTEVARRNAPAGAITYTSVAPSVRPKAAALTAETIDLSAFISLLNGNGGANVLAIKALNTSLNDPDLLIVPQLSISTVTAGPTYFTTPTPGAANGTGFVGYANSVAISAPHGYYTSTFTTTLTDSTPGATIYYTTDGSDPTPTNGTAISPASASATASGLVSISTTTTLRAAAFMDAFIPSAVNTATYIFVSAVLNQANSAPAGAYWDTLVDPRVVTATQTYSVSQALTAIPSVSLVLPYPDIFGSNGIYSHPTSRGSAWERETSFEYFDPNNLAAGFQVDAGLRIQGGADRGGGDPKKSFRLFFSSQYGASKLNYPLFGSSDPQQSFDHILLKGIHNYSWANGGGTAPSQGDLIRDPFARDLQLAITGHAAQYKWVQLYVNGLYWGVYNASEEPDSTWAAANFGGSKDDYDVLQPDGGGDLEVLAGSRTSYDSLFTTLTTDFADGSISTAEYAALQPLVDMKGLADYILTIFYRGDQDAPVLIGSTTSPRNFYVFRNSKTNGPIEFTTWDGELGLGDVNYNRTGVSGNKNPGVLFQDLKTNPNFAQLFADETYRLFYNNGPLESDSTVDNPKTLYDADAAQINVAIVGESARWGDSQQSTPLMRDTDWLNEINSLNTAYFPQRSGIVLGQLKAISQLGMLAILPPSFKVNGTANRGGQIASGSSLTLIDTNTATAGDVIYYTLDGSDPRTSTGGVALSAHLYSVAVPITASESVTVRILKGTTWSPIDAVNYGVNVAASASNIAIAEVHYHPPSATAAEHAVNTTWTDNDFEFIELLNTSNQTVDMTGAAFDLGVTITFGNRTLAPGQRVVVVSNATAFAARYGSSIAIAGTYTGHLSNSSATVELKSATAAVIANFTYQDSWYPRSDGDGSSLEAVSTTGNYNSASNWRGSYEINGTPSTAGTPVVDVVVNEVVSAAVAAGPDAIELYNTTSAPINIGGWYLSDSSASLTAFTIPANTIIAANGYVVFITADFGNAASPTDFNLNGTSGDQVFLVKPQAGLPYAFADSGTFGTSAIGESFGRVVTSNGVYLYPQKSITLGAVNSGARIGPLAITELGYNTSAGSQFVEVQNQTNAPLDVSGYQFSNGINYTFPAGTMLSPFEVVTIAQSLTTFRSTYGLDASARLLGPFTGNLASKGEQVTLTRPDAPRADNPGYTPLILVDDLTFGVASPWPVTGLGISLTRSSNHTIGEDPANWTAASPTLDQVSYGNAWFGGVVSYTYTTPTTLDSLTVAGTATVTLGSGAGRVANVGGLNVSAGAKLNVGSTDLDLANVSLSTINTLLASGFASGAWNGPGISSTSAAGDLARLTALGAIQNNQAGTAIFNAANKFDGTTPGASDVLVKYTYYGDANLDGIVDGSDYTKIDNGFNKPAVSGWLNGDFNYDGKTDGSDYTLIDNAFNTQGVSHASLIAGAVPTANIAEPTGAHSPVSTRTDGVFVYTTARKFAALTNGNPIQNTTESVNSLITRSAETAATGTQARPSGFAGTLIARARVPGHVLANVHAVSATDSDSILFGAIGSKSFAFRG